MGGTERRLDLTQLLSARFRSVKGKVKREYLRGLRHGIPTGLGYLSVSFGFGILAVNLGLSVCTAVGISATNLTSAGQVAGVGIIAAGGTLAEIVLTQLVINVRYSLMGISLTQRLSPSFRTLHRLLAAFFLTDEVFAVAYTQKREVTPAYMYGLGTIPFICWTLGTLLGAAAGEILPIFLTAALSISIYGMFIAIVVPPVRADRGVAFSVLLTVVLSCALRFIPGLNAVPEGFSVIICASLSSAAVALLRPVREVEG